MLCAKSTRKVNSVIQSAFVGYNRNKICMRSTKITYVNTTNLKPIKYNGGRKKNNYTKIIIIKTYARLFVHIFFTKLYTRFYITIKMFPPKIVSIIYYIFFNF